MHIASMQNQLESLPIVFQVQFYTHQSSITRTSSSDDVSPKRLSQELNLTGLKKFRPEKQKTSLSRRLFTIINSIRNICIAVHRSPSSPSPSFRTLQIPKRTVELEIMR